MLWSILAAALAVLSFILTLWQWLVARRFPVHQRRAGVGARPGVTLLKPLKGCDTKTDLCLRSWIGQGYDGPLQMLFGVASPEDPVCAVVRQLIQAHPQLDLELVICSQALGPNAKVSTLAQLQPHIRHEAVIISDADVWVPPDLVANLVVSLNDPEVGLVSCLYRLTDTVTPAMQWEAVAVNADFWSQVLQAESLGRVDFALGAVMGTKRRWLEKTGAFHVLLEYLADDYQLGHRIAQTGARVVLCPIVVECRSASMSWRQVLKHQLRWTRTIRICQPAPFFFSILSNATLWPLLWIAVDRTSVACSVGLLFLAARLITAELNQRRLAGHRGHSFNPLLVLLKDVLGVGLWVMAFAGNRVEWRGQRFRMLGDGRLEGPLD
ncbi:MAG: glycosyltransferase [Verrucomicrobiota bacterium]